MGRRQALPSEETDQSIAMINHANGPAWMVFQTWMFAYMWIIA